MLYLFYDPAMRHLNGRAEDHPLVKLHEPPQDTSEGGEFLDDAIHMDEVYVVPTEESISAGSPENFL